MSHNEQLNQSKFYYSLHQSAGKLLTIFTTESEKERERKREEGSITLFLEKYRESCIGSLTRSLARNPRESAGDPRKKDPHKEPRVGG
jgi:hypothetical protein